MAQDGYVDVTWIGGPYDGAALELPALYLGAQQVDMPDPATAGNQDIAAEPLIYTGPSHRYALQHTPGGLLARFVLTA